jgi:serine/threonine protein kinase/AraC-like DNA-binding protein
MDLSGITINNRFTLIKKTSEGPSGSIYLAHCADKKLEPAAVKIFRDEITSNRTEYIIRFRHELSTVSNLDHPNIVRIYEAGEVYKLHYIAMEYVQGTGLSEILKTCNLTLDQITSILIQLCSALDCIHKSGVIHRNLKPGNIIIDKKEKSDGFIAKLTDSGTSYVKDYNELMKKSENTPELFEYFSPEQVGIKKSRADERSDLFSLGVIFYQLLTGRLPFSGDEPFSLLHHYSVKPLEHPSNFNSGIPPLLDRIVLKLLEKEPENRYQSARGLLFDLERYKRGDREFILGLHDASVHLSYRTRLVGREKELDDLKAVFNRAREGNGGLCLIRGEAGIGKTRLVEELRDYIRSKNTMFIHTKCFSGENKEPYRLLQDTLDEYLKIFSSYPDKKKKEIKNIIREAVGVFGEAILKLNPRMKEILERCPSMVPLEPERENARFLAVASQFFIGLSCIENGLVLSMDDLQWCDEGTLELLARIVDDSSKSPLLVIGTYRHDEITGRQGLIKFIRDAENKGKILSGMTIEHFEGQAMNTFISGLLYDKEINVKEISDFIHQKSKGNPFFAIEILKQLVEEKALYYQDNKWDIDHTILCRSVIPLTIIDILIKRISNLGPKESTVLSCAAVAGKNFEFELLFRLLGNFDKQELVGILDACIQLQLVYKDPAVPGRLSFAHDRIQEAFYGSIDLDTRRSMHARIAETLEAIYGDSKNEILFELTHQYIESGNKDKSLEYAYPASFKAAENFANEDALKYFNIAVELLEKKISDNDDTIRPLWMKSKEGMARVYLRIGRYDEAIDIFNELLSFEDAESSRALVLGDLSAAYRKKGDWANSEKYAKIGIEMLKGTLPIKRGAVIASLIKELFVHCVHLLLPGIFVTKRPKPKAGNKMEQRIFYESLIYTYVLSDRLKFVRAVLRILNQVERYFGEGKAFARALNVYGTLLMSLTRFKDALKYFYKSLAIATEINDHHCIGRSYQLIGLCHEWQGIYAQAIENYHKAIDVFTMIGDINEIGITLNGLSNIYFFLADFDKLKTIYERYLAIAYKSMDNYQISNALICKTLYYLGTGRLDEADAHGLEAYTLSYNHKIWMPHCIVNIVLGMTYHYADNVEKSIKHLKKAKRLYKKYKFLKYYAVYLYPYIADVSIAEFLQKKDMTNKQRNLHLKKIEKYCRLSLKKTKRLISYYPLSLTVNAKYCALIKKNKKAKRLFLQATGLCTKLGLKLELANNLYEYGQFLAHVGDNNESRIIWESAYQIVKDIGSGFYLERLRRVLGIGDETEAANLMQGLIYNKRLLSIDEISAQINQIIDFDELLNAVITNAVEITCAQKGYLFIANNYNELELKAFTNILESEGYPYSPEIVEKVFTDDAEIITLLEPANKKMFDPSFKSSDIKSILAVPVKIKDRIWGVCYLENSSSNRQFTGEDVNLLRAFISKVSQSINYGYLYHQSKVVKNEGQWIITPCVEKKMKEAISYLKENYRFTISREGLANMLNINSDNLGRYFKMFTGEKIGDFINRLRIQEAAKKLKKTEENVIHIAFSVGFENISTFNKAFVKFMKTTPTDYRKFISDR